MKVSTLSVELDWKPGRQGRVVLRWADRVAYVWLVDDRLAAQLSSDPTHLDQWFAERLEKVFEGAFGEVGGSPPEEKMRVETHHCVWVADAKQGGVGRAEVIVYRCMLRWSTGEQCDARTLFPHVSHEARRRIELDQPAP